MIIGIAVQAAFVVAIQLWGRRRIAITGRTANDWLLERKKGEESRYPTPRSGRRLWQIRRNGTRAGDFVRNRMTTLARNYQERPESRDDGRNQPGD